LQPYPLERARAGKVAKTQKSTQISLVMFLLRAAEPSLGTIRCAELFMPL